MYFRVKIIGNILFSINITFSATLFWFIGVNYRALKLPIRVSELLLFFNFIFSTITHRNFNIHLICYNTLCTMMQCIVHDCMLYRGQNDNYVVVYSVFFNNNDVVHTSSIKTKEYLDICFVFYWCNKILKYDLVLTRSSFMAKRVFYFKS